MNAAPVTRSLLTSVCILFERYFFTVKYDVNSESRVTSFGLPIRKLTVKAERLGLMCLHEGNSAPGKEPLVIIARFALSARSREHLVHPEVFVGALACTSTKVAVEDCLHHRIGGVDAHVWNWVIATLKFGISDVRICRRAGGSWNHRSDQSQARPYCDEELASPLCPALLGH